MSRWVWLFYVLLSTMVRYGYGQCTLPSFNLSSSACLKENLTFDNTTIASYNFEWDFCAGDLRGNPTATEVLNNSNFFRARSIKFVNEGNQWFAFSISSTANILMRLDFGQDLTSTPTFNNLGNVGNVLSGAFGFDIVKEDGVYYMLVANGSGNNIIRYAFNSGLTSSPQATIISIGTSFNSSSPNALRIVQDGNEKIVFVSAGNTVATTKVVRLDMGSSIVNDNPSASEFTVTGANQLRGISFMKECDQWYGFGVAVSTNALYRMSFGTNIKSIPSILTLNTAGLLNQPASIEVRNEMGKYYAFIQSARTDAPNAGIYRVSFGESISSQSVSTEKILYTALVGGGYAFDMVSDNSEWFAYTFNLTNQSLVRYGFPNACAAQTPFLSSQDQKVANTYASAGKYYVVLKGTDNDGLVYTKLDSVTISGTTAPDIAFSSQNVCANHDVNFSSVNTSADITDYSWDFDDTSMSVASNPVHQFSLAGAYSVSLTVTASNGCTNSATNDVFIYDEPTPNFQPPAPSQFCTNQPYTFTNESLTDPNYPGVTWEWLVNNVQQSTSQDFQTAFTQTSNQDITLRATIPGCTNEITKSIPSLSAGPVTSFSFIGQCQNEDIVFTNNSSGDITGYTWDFDDGQSSTDANPTHVYSSNGVPNVTLTAIGSSGCENTFTVQVPVYTQPSVDFYAELPPYSCSGTQTFLHDATTGPTDSNLSSWAWDFGDPGSAQNSSSMKDPTHVYAAAGDYNVQLTVGTNRGCSATFQKPISVRETPSINASHSPVCKDVPTTFFDQTPNAQSWVWTINSQNFYTQNVEYTFNTTDPKNVKLLVTSVDGCQAVKQEQVKAPVPLTADFTFLKNCVSEQTLLTDVTADASDPIVNRKWSFQSQEINSTEPGIEYSFASTGNVAVNFEVEATSGCRYAVVKNVPIVSKPFSWFTATPVQGGTPLFVQFTNYSTGSTSYFWNFGDGTGATSTRTNPSFVYNVQGLFEISLTATNVQQCSSTSKQLIKANAPYFDAVITQLDLVSGTQGSSKPVVTILNDGNVLLTDFTLIINIDNNARLSEQITQVIPPSGLYTYEVPFDVIEAGVKFVCAELIVEGDLDPQNNRSCISIGDATTSIIPYPNPANSELYVEWIAANVARIQVTMTNSLGREVGSWVAESSVGLNQLRISTDTLAAGLYTVSVETHGQRKTYRVVVDH